MSNPIRYDPLLVRHLAAELETRLVGRGCAPAPVFDADGVALLPLDGDQALRLDLHPRRGWIRIVPYRPDTPSDLVAVCEAVTAPTDERRLCLELRGGARFRDQDRRLVVELHGNQWNVLLIDAATDAIVSALRARTAGERELRPGAIYRPPAPRPRVAPDPHDPEAALQRWYAVLAATPPAARAALLIRDFAGTGSLNAEPILGDAASTPDAGALREAFHRWQALWTANEARPVILLQPTGVQPYPFPLPGVAAEAAASLLDGMEAAAAERSATAPTPAPSDRLAAGAQQRLDELRRRRERIEQQMSDGEASDVIRGRGDLLLAYLARVPKGASTVKLPGWDGVEIEIPLDPALSPADNAAQWYARARRRARAEERLPALLREAETEEQRWAEAVQSAQQGELPAWATRRLEMVGGSRAENAARVDAPALPYRSYRTAGGLEVRVGRSARDNDRLTFGHSAPNDVWLHARSVPGSHIILRWPDAAAAPPARDLLEAAGLAAWNSKARSSGLVPVDWTRRKHVRKPRGAAPGAVVPTQVRTLMVEPDPELEGRLTPSPTSDV